EDYLGRISGPLMDRFDLRVEVPPVAYADLDLPATGEPSATVAARVAEARARQTARFQGHESVRVNAEAEGALLQEVATPEPEGRALLAQVAENLALPFALIHCGAPEDIRRKPADEPKPVKRAVKTARKPDTRFRRLSEIVPKPAGDRFEALIKADGGITDYRSFFLKSPPKLVIDIPGKWEQKTRSVIEMDHDLVKRVRVGEHPEFIRVVLDLEKEKVSKPDFTETAEGLRVSLTRDSE
ncbi:MAG: AMIN domain-containing protein, partial [Thermodesulfobacteriota bacterium]